MTKQELLVSGGLDFTVSKVKLHTYDVLHPDDYNPTAFFSTVNNTSGEALGPVRSRYTVMQNSELLDNIVEKLEPDTYNLDESKCGYFNGGKKIYFFIKLNNTVGLNFANDLMDLYLYALSSHDGSQRLVYGISTKMHSCSNMFATLMSDKDNNHVVKHTAKISKSSGTMINEMIHRNKDGLVKLFTRMSAHKPSEEFIEKTKDIIAKTSIKGVRQSTINNRAELSNCITSEMSSKGDSYYGLFNGVTNYTTHQHTSDYPKEYELLTGTSNNYNKKVFSLIVQELVDTGVCLN
jgi:hypothetical protein